jgi:hypothetical protein
MAPTRRHSPAAFSPSVGAIRLGYDGVDDAQNPSRSAEETCGGSPLGCPCRSRSAGGRSEWWHWFCSRVRTLCSAHVTEGRRKVPRPCQPVRGTPIMSTCHAGAMIIRCDPVPGADRPCARAVLSGLRGHLYRSALLSELQRRGRVATGRVAIPSRTLSDGRVDARARSSAVRRSIGGGRGRRLGEAVSPLDRACSRVSAEARSTGEGLGSEWERSQPKPRVTGARWPRPIARWHVGRSTRDRREPRVAPSVPATSVLRQAPSSP